MKTVMKTAIDTHDNLGQAFTQGIDAQVQRAQMQNETARSINISGGAQLPVVQQEAQSDVVQREDVQPTKPISLAPTTVPTIAQAGAVDHIYRAANSYQALPGELVTRPIADINVGPNRRPVKDVASLQQSIEKHGLLHPITISASGALIAGQRRLEAYKAMGFDAIPATVIDCDPLSAELLQIDENLMRDELTVLERAEQICRRKAIYEELHPLTKAGVAGGKARHGNSSGVSSFATDTSQKSGCSERSVQQDDQIGRMPQHTRDAIRDKPIAGSKSDLLKLARLKPEQQREYIPYLQNDVARTFEEAKAEWLKADVQRQKNDIAEGKVTLPEGVFEVISMDVPWPYDDMDVEKKNGWGRNQLPYPPMSLEQIRDLEIPAAEHCILFFWTTHRFLRHSFDLLDNWGFRDVSIITWVKGKDEDTIQPGLGVWLRTESEYCIMAVKGKPKRFTQLTDQGTVLYGARREHSRKPEEFYEMVERLCCYSTGRKLDYFSRAPRLGWETFGNETNKFADDPHTVDPQQR